MDVQNVSADLCRELLQIIYQRGKAVDDLMDMFRESYGLKCTYCNRAVVKEPLPQENAVDYYARRKTTLIEHMQSCKKHPLREEFEKLIKASAKLRKSNKLLGRMCGAKR